MITWYAVPNDMIGGWMIRTIDKLPSIEPGYYIADFLTEEHAKEIVELHNNSVMSYAVQKQVEQLIQLITVTPQYVSLLRIEQILGVSFYKQYGETYYCRYCGFAQTTELLETQHFTRCPVIELMLT